jgi:uncharacterized protein (TIGR02300 family)
MGRPELGMKCVCVGCGERFYDLLRVPAVCPKCGLSQPPRAPRVIRPMRKPSEPMRLTPRPAAVVEDAEAEADVDDPATILDPDEAEDDEIDEEIDVDKPPQLE